MKFGTKRVTMVTDDAGSTKTLEVQYRNGIASNPVRVRKEIRMRVEDHDNSLRDEFFESANNHPEWKDVSYQREYTITGNRGGYYYAVMSYTELRDPTHHVDLLDLIYKV